MPEPERIGGLTLAQFAEISARLIGLGTAEQCYAAAQAAGVDRATWDAANRGWTARLQREGQGSELARAHRRILVTSLRRLLGDREPISLDRYIAINVGVQSGVAAEVVFAEHGETVQSFSASSYEWIDRFAADPWLEVYFQLRVQKGIAERTHRSPRDEGAVYGPGNLVRGRRCHACGALKATKPRTAYVYCDYCATLFDYDPRVAIEDPSALDPDMVDRALDRVTRDQLRQAAAANDRVEYARISRWRSLVSAEICPAAYSPRIRDPDYRRAFVDDLIVPWTVATRFDAAAREHGMRVEEAQQIAIHRPRLEPIMTLLERSQRLWEIEGELLEREGIFAAHPDGLDRSLYLYVNASGFVRPWLAFLREPDQETLLAAAGVACEYIAMPPVDFAARSCGQCGDRLMIPEGAQRFVCESCGFILEAHDRAFACAQCGGTVCLPRAATAATCGFCGAAWTL